MASTDWTALTNSLDAATVDKGVTNGVTRPSGGGNFVYGFNSVAVPAAAGAVGLFTNQVNFAPHAKGVSIRGCVKRLPSGGPTGFAPFFFACLGGSTVADSGYLFGCADDDPYHLVLAKGTIEGGLADAAPDPSVNGILLQSGQTYPQDTWHHLRVDVIVNLNGDVLIQCFENDLTANPLTGAPVWTAISGMTQFIDDALGINSGSAPYASGRSGFAFYTTDVTRRAAFDHIQIYRQQ